MGKKTEDKKKQEAPKKNKGGCLKKMMLLVLLLVMSYLGVHIYFLWQPAGKPDALSRSVMDVNVAGFRIFPALKSYEMNHIAGRSEILEGKPIEASMLQARLDSAVERNYPVTFREEEVNVWLSKRLAVEQDGMLAPFVKAKGVWVDFKKDEVEIIIEREVQGRTHVSSMFMQFESAKRGYSIRRDTAHIGQVRLPGGFSRLIMPAYDNLIKELADEMQLYRDKKIQDIRVEDGKITFDPRKPEDRL